MSKEITQFDKNAAKVATTMAAFDGGQDPKFFADRAQDSSLMSAEAVRHALLQDMKTSVRQLDALRKGGADNRPVDMSLGEFAKLKFGFGTLDSFYTALGVDPSQKTIESLMTMPEFDEGYRWLVPEVIRGAVRLGLRRNPIYPGIIAGEEAVSQKQVIMPFVNMSAATPEKVGEADTIPVGAVSFGQRTVKLQKIGTGIKVSDEVLRYVSLNIVSLYFQDVGVRMAMGMDSLAVNALINGDDSEDAFSAPVIGVQTTNTLAYYDLLRAWIRMGRLGRSPQAILSSEDAALTVLELLEFKGANYNNTKQNIDLRTPVPQSQAYFVHGSAPSGKKVVLIDTTSALLKMNATGLLLESERIVERQLNGTYATQTTGFARLFQDAVLVIDSTQAFSSAGFPAYMNADAAEAVTFS